jgi:hypothetical protein
MGRYRSVPDPLATVSEPRWLVVRDRASRPVVNRALPGGADLKATLAAERQRLIGEGWRADPMTRYSFVYWSGTMNGGAFQSSVTSPVTRLWGTAPTLADRHLGSRDNSLTLRKRAVEGRRWRLKEVERPGPRFLSRCGH